MTFVSFAAAAAIIALCIRLRNKENQKKGGTSKSNRNEQEEKAYEETNTQHPAHLVYGAMPCARALFAEDNEDTPAQALANVNITFPKPEEGKKIGDGSAASANADSGLNLYLFGPALWKQDGNHQKLKADDTYQKGPHLSAEFHLLHAEAHHRECCPLTCNGSPTTALCGPFRRLPRH